MNRLDCIQAAIAATSARTYLEIGVSRGRTFLRVRAPRKLAVDPEFRVPWWSKTAALLRDPRNRYNRYFEMTSAAFFRERMPTLDAARPDVVFVDGLHAYEAVLDDVLSSLEHLQPGGLILLHDCNPDSAACAQPASSPAEAAGRGTPGWTGDWCGDVWKAVVHLRATRRDVTAFVLDGDWGIGVVDPSRSSTTSLDLTPDDIRALDYDDLDADRTRMLDLRPMAAWRPYLAARGRG